jgi:hypothetical protein
VDHVRLGRSGRPLDASLAAVDVKLDDGLKAGLDNLTPTRGYRLGDVPR